MKGPSANSGDVASLRGRAAEFGLSLEEFDQVVGRLGREPNVVEAGVFGALWSEHCGYKNSRPLLRRLPTKGQQVLQGPGENAGVVDIGSGLGVAFKMESHNHPSAVEPVQGAATGVGGILRDIFAMGARPFAVLDSLRFGELTSARSRHLLSGVVAGIASYGNAVGVPTVGGEVEVNACFEENPLVNVMALGLVRHEDLKRGTVGEAGNRLLYVGSRTGRDGLGGAVFASADLSVASEADRPAVQVGDPFMEKLLLEACLDAYAAGLVAGVQDMGAAGLASSVAEMAHRAGRGVDLDLSAVPRRETGMTPLEVMLSESQERMMLTAKPGLEDELLALFDRYGLEAAWVGVVRDHGELRLIEAGEVVGAMPVAALNEPPEYVRDGVEDEVAMTARTADLSSLAPAPDPEAALTTLLAAPSIASKEAVYRRFDHQVMTNSVVLPGRAGAAVMRVKGTDIGVAATVDCNSRYVWLDPRLGAAHAVAEAARNLSCVGAEPLGVTDNLNFGNPTDLGVYYQMEQAVAGISEACIALGTPVTGGNVSLYNQYQGDGGVRAVHPTPTIGMVGVLADVSHRATQDLKRSSDRLFLLGVGVPSVGGSEYLFRMHGLEAGSPPELDLVAEAAVQRAVRRLISAGVCDTAHDVSTGGLAVCLAEMAMTGEMGLSADAPPVDAGPLRRDVALFGESAARVVVAVPAAAEQAVSDVCEEEGVPHVALGEAGGQRFRLAVSGSSGEGIDMSIADLLSAWNGTFAEALG